jgi:hypothetical protein
MDCLTIRPATQADVPAISALIQRTVRQSNASDYAAQVVELICANYAPDKVAQRLLERDVFVCLEGPRMVGTVGLGGATSSVRCSSSRVCRARASVRGWSRISKRVRARPASPNCTCRRRSRRAASTNSSVTS